MWSDQKIENLGSWGLIPYQEAKCDGDDDSGDNGDGGKVVITEVAGKRLDDDGEGEHSQAAEDGRPCNLPYLVEL